MKLLLLLFGAILLTGCRTSSGSYSKKNDVSAVTLEHVSLRSITTDNEVKSIISNYKATLTGTIRHFLPPDSTGNPVLVSEGDFKLEINGSSQEDSLSESQKEEDLQADHETHLTDQSEEQEEKKTDSRLIRFPAWLTGLLATSWVIFLFILFRKYKKAFL